MVCIFVYSWTILNKFKWIQGLERGSKEIYNFMYKTENWKLPLAFGNIPYIEYT